MGWTLGDVWGLDADIYHALIAWINDQSREHDPDDIDMDAFIAAKKAADGHGE